jgi:hypothetical protein
MPMLFVVAVSGVFFGPIRAHDWPNERNAQVDRTWLLVSIGPRSVLTFDEAKPGPRSDPDEVAHWCFAVGPGERFHQVKCIGTFELAVTGYMLGSGSSPTCVGSLTLTKAGKWIGDREFAMRLLGDTCLGDPLEVTFNSLGRECPELPHSLEFSLARNARTK